MSHNNASNNPYQGMTIAQVLATMGQLVKDEDLNHFHMGQLYNYTVDSKLVQGTKYKTAVELFTANIQEVSRAALLMYGAVAGAFREEVCRKFGITRLKLLLTYKGALNVQVNHDEPGGTFILVPDEHGEAKPRMFADCGVEDMRKALGHLRADSTGKAIPAEEVVLADQYRKAITGRFPTGTPVKVQLRSHQGETVVDFKGIPLSQVDKLTEALLEQLYPAHEVPEAPAAEVS